MGNGNSNAVALNPLLVNGENSHFIVAPAGNKGSFTVIGLRESHPAIAAMMRALQTTVSRNTVIKVKEQFATKLSTGTSLTISFTAAFETALKNKLAWTVMFLELHKVGYKPLNSDGKLQNYTTNLQ